jgi:hypothetical protein
MTRNTFSSPFDLNGLFGFQVSILFFNNNDYYQKIGASKKGGCTVLDLPVNTVVNPIESPDRKDSFAART